MKVTPLDIRRKEFRRSVRGYLDEDVDVFLDVVADEVERISKVNSELEAKVKSLEEQVAGHSHIREALENTLVAAQLQSEEMKSKAQKESQSMLREAEIKAKTVVDDLYAQAESVQQSLMQLKLLEEEFRSKLRGMLQGYMKLLEEGPALSYVSEQPAPAATAPAAATTAPTPAVTAPTPATTAPAPATTAPAPATTAPAPGSAPLPPSLPVSDGGGAAPSIGEDDSTVEVAQAPERREGSVYFGKQEEDLDDPFPEIGGDPAQPRDFAW